MLFWPLGCLGSHPHLWLLLWTPSTHCLQGFFQTLLWAQFCSLWKPPLLSMPPQSPWGESCVSIPVTVFSWRSQNLTVERNFRNQLTDRSTHGPLKWRVYVARFFFQPCFCTEGVDLCGSQLYARVSTPTSQTSWSQRPVSSDMLFTRIQVLGHWDFSDGLRQMPALVLAYFLNSHFLIPPTLLEFLLLSSQFSHAL